MARKGMKGISADDALEEFEPTFTLQHDCDGHFCGRNDDDIDSITVLCALPPRPLRTAKKYFLEALFEAVSIANLASDIKDNVAELKT